MIVHIVLFRPKAGLTPDAWRGLAQAFSTALREIGSIKRAQIGRRTLHGRPYEQLMHENYTHVALLEFDDLAGLTSYLGHPTHEQLGAQFFACFEQALVYDFDTHDADHAVMSLLEGYP